MTVLGKLKQGMSRIKTMLTLGNPDGLPETETRSPCYLDNKDLASKMDRSMCLDHDGKDVMLSARMEDIDTQRLGDALFPSGAEPKEDVISGDDLISDRDRISHVQTYLVLARENIKTTLDLKTLSKKVASELRKTLALVETGLGMVSDPNEEIVTADQAEVKPTDGKRLKSKRSKKRKSKKEKKPAKVRKHRIFGTLNDPFDND